MKIKGLILILILTVLVCTVSVSAYDSYLYGKYVNIATVKFAIGGEEITALPDEGEVTVSTKIKKGSDAASAMEVSIVAAAYSDSKLIRTAVGTAVLEDAYSTEVSAGIDVSGADELRAYVCDNLTNGRPFAKKAIFADSAVELEAIRVGNEDIANFSPEKTSYDIVVSAGYTSFPEVTPRIKNSGIKCDVSYTGRFPLSYGEKAKAVLTLTSQDSNQTKTYTVNITQEEAAVTNAASSATAVSVRADLKEPEFVSSVPEVPVSDAELTEGYGSNFLQGHALFQDRTNPIMFIPPVLLGSTVIGTQLTYKDTYHYNNGKDTLENGISFDINRTATLYMLVSNYSSAWIEEQGFVKDTAMKIQWVNQNTTQGRLMTYSGIIKKRVEVQPGETVNIKTGPIAFGFVVFDDGSLIKNAELKTSETEKIELTVIEKLYNADYYNDKHPAYTGELDNYKAAVGFISDKPEYYSTDFPTELLDAEGIAFPLNFRRNYTYAGTAANSDVISFDADRPVNVYVFYASTIDRMPWMQEFGFSEVEDEDFKIKYVWGTNSAYTVRAFKKTYDIQPGEVRRIELGGIPAAVGSNVPFKVIVDEIEE